MSKKYTGHCACGQVTYGFDTEPTFIGGSMIVDGGITIMTPRG